MLKDYDSHTFDNRSYFMRVCSTQVVFGYELVLHEPDELKKYQLGFNSSNLVEEMLERQNSLLTSLYQFQSRFLRTKMSYAIRLIQAEPSANLGVFILFSVAGREWPNVIRIADELRGLVEGIPPFDYDLVPMQQPELVEVVLPRELKQPDLTAGILFPRVRVARGANGEAVPVFGSWTSNNSKYDNLMRSLNNARSWSAIDILLEPILPTYTAAFYERAKSIYHPENSSGQLNDALQSIINHRENGERTELFSVQHRVFSQDDFSILANVLASLSVQGHGGVTCVRSRRRTSQWVECFSRMKFIAPRSHLNFKYHRVPFFSTLDDALGVARWPTFVKGLPPSLRM